MEKEHARAAEPRNYEKRPKSHEGDCFHKKNK